MTLTETVAANSAANERICQCHVEQGTVNDTLAVFLIGAYSGKTASGSVYGSFFGYGPWDSDVDWSGSWNSMYWPSFFDKPLGAPLAKATKSGGVYTREFAGDGQQKTVVTFDTATNRGCVRWAGAPCPRRRPQRPTRGA